MIRSGWLGKQCMRVLVLCLLPLFSIFIAIVIANGVFLILDSKPALSGHATQEYFNCRGMNPILGGGFKAKCASQWTRTDSSGTNVIFDVYFTTDKWARRKTPSGINPTRNSLALFFGCSFTLGAGVNDDETSPYFFSRRSPEFKVYNYSGSGFGPQQMLSALKEMDIPAQVKKASGRKIAIYQFLDFHIERAVGKPGVYLSFARYFPFYRFDQQGKLVLAGAFSSDRPISKLYDWLAKVPIFRFLLERFGNSIDEQDYSLAAAIIEESRKEFKKQFGSDEFYVVLYPSNKSETKKKLIYFLERSGTKYIDLSDLVDMSSTGARLADGHPSASTQKIVGEKLAVLLKQRPSLKKTE